jgi:hypothetical protein
VRPRVGRLEGELATPVQVVGSLKSDDRCAPCPEDEIYVIVRRFNPIVDH